MTDVVGPAGPPTGSVPRWADPEPDLEPVDPVVPAAAHASIPTQPVDVVAPADETLVVDVRSASVTIDLPLDDEPLDARPLDARPLDARPLEGDAVGDPRPDPRFEARRARAETEARAERRGRRRRVLAWTSGIAFVALLTAGLVVSPVLDVDRIEVVGSELIAAADISARTGVHVGDPTLFVDPDAMAAELRTDPQFSRVVVDRRFPSVITVRLTERRRIARLAGPTRSVIVGSDGIVIAVARGDEFLQLIEMPTDPPDRPGAELPPDIAAAVDVLGSMSFEVAVQIQKQMITEDGELVFDLGEGRTVLFGTVEDADKKLLAVRTMLGPQIDTSGLCQLDVRVPTAPTIRRRPRCDPPPPPAPPADAAADPAAGAPADPAAAPADPAAATPSTAPPAGTPTTAAPTAGATVPTTAAAAPPAP